MTYDKGDRTQLVATCRDIAGVLTDPTDITFVIKAPNGALVTYSFGVNIQIVKDGVGIYHVDFDLTQSGTYKYKWFGVGALVAAEESAVFVRVSGV